MSDMDVLTATVKSTLQEIGKQASALGTGLQNAAPSDKAEKPNNSVQYLLGISDVLVKVADECDELSSNFSNPTQPKP